MLLNYFYLHLLAFFCIIYNIQVCIIYYLLLYVYLFIILWIELCKCSTALYYTLTVYSNICLTFFNIFNIFFFYFQYFCSLFFRFFLHSTRLQCCVIIMPFIWMRLIVSVVRIVLWFESKWLLSTKSLLFSYCVFYWRHLLRQKQS